MDPLLWEQRQAKLIQHKDDEIRTVDKMIRRVACAMLTEEEKKYISSESKKLARTNWLEQWQSGKIFLKRQNLTIWMSIDLNSISSNDKEGNIKMKNPTTQEII